MYFFTEYFPEATTSKADSTDVDSKELKEEVFSLQHGILMAAKQPSQPSCDTMSGKMDQIIGQGHNLHEALAASRQMYAMEPSEPSDITAETMNPSHKLHAALALSRQKYGVQPSAQQNNI